MVKQKKLKVIWSNFAKAQLKEIYNYIKKDSEKAALEVKNKILLSTKVLATGKEIYKTDELKLNNTGIYRAYVIYSYRITYKINKDVIEILRVRHTSREPLEH
jgi:addiction module RelE/StbE family toxin